MSKRILEDFHQLTEIEIKAAVDIIKSDTENKCDMGMSYILAVRRCRKILKAILEGNKNE